MKRQTWDELDHRLRQIVLWRRDGVTLREIGSRLGVCGERVRQLEYRAVTRLTGIPGNAKDHQSIESYIPREQLKRSG